MRRVAACICILLASTIPLAAQQIQPNPDTAAFGDWEKSCVARATGGEDCRLIQFNQNSATGNTIMRSEIAVSNDGTMLVLFTVPLGMDLGAGPWLTVDGIFIEKLAYERCTSDGCNAIGRFTRSGISYLLNGTGAIVTLQPQIGVRVGVPVSLNGLSEGYTALLSTRTPQ